MKVKNHKKNARKALLVRKSRPCPNCGKPGPHFVPPSLGEPGFFTCKKP